MAIMLTGSGVMFTPRFGAFGGLNFQCISALLNTSFPWRPLLAPQPEVAFLPPHLVFLKTPQLFGYLNTLSKLRTP